MVKSLARSLQNTAPFPPLDRQCLHLIIEGQDCGVYIIGRKSGEIVSSLCV